MPRARSTASVEAEKLYHAGNKLVDIARTLGVPDGTVRRWKSDQDWDGNKAASGKKKQTERSESKPNARKRGAQPGNKNSKGGPVGNIKPVTHGAFMKFYEDVLTNEEAAAYQTLIQQEERDRLRTLYAQHQITERRLMEEINAIKNGAEMITHRTVSQVEPSGKKGADGREITKVVKISQEQATRKEQLRNFTDALTRVRAEMRRVADSLRQLTESESKAVITESTQSLLDAMTEAFENRMNSDKDE